MKSIRGNHHRFAEIIRPSLRNGFNGFLRALLGDRACLPPSPAEDFFRQLDASVGASGPHDFAVRKSAARPRTECARRFHVHRIPSPTFVTIASRPSFGDETLLIYRCFYLFAKRNIFGKGDGQPRDKIDVDLPVGQITQPALRHAHSMRSGICARAFSVPIESERRLYFFVGRAFLTRTGIHFAGKRSILSKLTGLVAITVAGTNRSIAKWEDGLNATKGNHGSRRLGRHRSVGNRTDRAGAADAATPTARAYGRYQEAFGRRLSARNRQLAFGPGQVPIVSRPRPGDDLPGIWSRRRTRLKRFAKAV